MYPTITEIIFILNFCRRAYALARSGEEVSIPERTVEVYALELLEELPEGQARFRVECSKGTYVRSLGRDLAEKLGTCGFLQELRRTKCGQFGLESKIWLKNWEPAAFCRRDRKSVV